MSDNKANWDFLTTQEVDVKQESATEVKTEVADVKGETLTIETPATEPVKTETAPATEPAKTEEAKPAETTETKPTTELTLELTPEDIKDAPVLHPEGSALALAQDFGIKLEKDDMTAFKEALKSEYVPKAELEKAQQATTEVLYSKLDPKLATAFKMIDMGIPPELAMNPTGQHDYLLALSDAELIRLKLEGLEGVTPEAVDAKMEEMATDGKLANLAVMERAEIKRERQNILNTQSSEYNKLVEQKQLEQVRVKQESDNQFLQALGKESAFIGLPLSKEAKAVIEAKFKKGSYDNVLNEPQNKLLAILHHEFGHKFIQTAISKAETNGANNIVRKLSDVPPKKEFGGGKTQESVESTDKRADNFNFNF